LAATRGDIRRTMRARRRELTHREQSLAATRLSQSLQNWQPWRRARSVALYLPNDGELDPRHLIRLARKSGKRVYLPVLAPFGVKRLWFRLYNQHTRLAPNRFGIPEPAPRGSPRLPAQRLDMVLVPLVAFDHRGQRLGMGAGYYDRTFGFLSRRIRWQHPRLVGVAHHFQQTGPLPVEPWDVPLSAVATDRNLLVPGT